MKILEALFYGVLVTTTVVLLLVFLVGGLVSADHYYGWRGLCVTVFSYCSLTVSVIYYINKGVK